MVRETSSSIDKMIQKDENIEKDEIGEFIRIEKEKSEQNKKNKKKNSTEINKIQNKNKTINIISSKVDKQIFFHIIDKIDDEETQIKYLQNLKSLILT